MDSIKASKIFTISFEGDLILYRDFTYFSSLLWAHAMLIFMV